MNYIDRLKAALAVHQKTGDILLGLVQEHMESLGVQSEVHPSVQIILQVVADHLHIPASSIRSKLRISEIVYARTLTLALCTELLSEMTPSQVGRILNIEEGSARWGVRRSQNWLAVDKKFKADFEHCLAAAKGRLYMQKEGVA